MVGLRSPIRKGLLPILVGSIRGINPPLLGINYMISINQNGLKKELLHYLNQQLCFGDPTFSLEAYDKHPILSIKVN
jgi:hypothetical protein